jgi:hypothetical protein
MSVSKARCDELVSTIFNQLEVLQDLAIKAGEAELAQDLSSTLATALTRYCDRKREALSDAIDKRDNDLRRSA